MCSKNIFEKKKQFLRDLTRNFIRSQVFLKILNRSAKMSSQLVGYYIILIFPKKIQEKSQNYKIFTKKTCFMTSKSFDKLSFYLHKISIVESEVSNVKIRHTLSIPVKKTIKVKRRKKFRGNYYLMPRFFFKITEITSMIWTNKSSRQIL